MHKKPKKSTAPQIILGIDPGYADTGYGVIQVENGNTKTITYGNIKTHKTNSFPDRLFEIHSQISKLIKKHHPNLLSVEELFFYKNAKTALNVGHARGVVILTAKQHNIPIVEFTPLQIKQTITGYGRADKKQMQKMIQTTLGLKKIPKPDDAADALAVALTAAFWKNL